MTSRLKKLHCQLLIFYHHLSYKVHQGPLVWPIELDVVVKTLDISANNNESELVPNLSFLDSISWDKTGVLLFVLNSWV